jgi:hypothetical protein
MSDGQKTPGFWAALMDYASLSIRKARTNPEERKIRVRDARFYINQARLYDAPKLP